MIRRPRSLSTAHGASLLALLLLAAGSPPAMGETRQLLRVRAAPWEDRFRVVLDLSAPSEYRSQVLTGPDRIVIEMPRTSAQGAPLPKIDEWMVTGLQVEDLPDSTARVEIALARALATEVFVVPAADGKPFRVVCDIFRPKEPERKVTGRWLVMIDPGHGGRDPGATARQMREKGITLDVARRLAKRLNREPGVVARLTRESDTRVGLKRRVQRAEAADADAFVSVHVNGCRDRSARGAEVFFLSVSGASDAAAREVEALENAAAEAGEDTVLAAIAGLPFGADLLQTDTLRRSSLLAESILNALERSDLAAARGVKQANFLVLRSARMPSALVEVGFLSNPGDARRLASPTHRQALAETIAKGLLEYRARYARQTPASK
jgi:N-acetylmuramoyl-L-alanine amidase